jgi:hypothetical protein
MPDVILAAEEHSKNTNPARCPVYVEPVDRACNGKEMDSWQDIVTCRAPQGKACQPIGGLADLPDAARRLVEGFLGAFAKGQMGLKQTIEDQIEVTSGV